MTITRDRAEIIAHQGSQCPICRGILRQGVIDHDHDRTIRGIVCRRCTTAVDSFESIARRCSDLGAEHGHARTIEILRNAIAYLESAQRHGHYAVFKRRERIIAARRARSARIGRLPD